MNVQEKVITIIQDQLGSGHDIKLESEVLNSSGIDPYECIEIVMRLEEELGVEIPDEEAEKLHTVKDVVNYIEKIKSPKQENKKEEKK